MRSFVFHSMFHPKAAVHVPPRARDGVWLISALVCNGLRALSLSLESRNVAQAHLEMPHGALHTYVALFNDRALQEPCKAPND